MRRKYLFSEPLDATSIDVSTRVVCPVCFKHVLIRKDGHLRVHKKGFDRCPGSFNDTFGHDSSINDLRTKMNDITVNLHSDIATNGGNSFVNRALHILSHKPILPHIPKGARYSIAVELSKCLNLIVSNPTNEDHWMSYFTFTRDFLCININDKTQTLTSKIKHALEIKNVSNNLITPTVNKKRRIINNSSDFLGKLIEKKLNDGDVKGAVRLASSTDSVAINNNKTLEVLKELHPYSSSISMEVENSMVNEESQTTLTLDPTSVMQGIKAFPPGSSAGMSGLRPQHLKELCSKTNGDAADKLLSSLTDFINIIISGKCPLSIRPIFFGANLIALTKKNGGTRPIAIGDTVRRLISKIIVLKHRKLSNIFKPIQMGFAIRAGCEAIVHAMRIFLSRKHKITDTVMKVDFYNAFNKANRKKIIALAESHMPSVRDYIRSSYEYPSVLRYHDNVIWSQEGVQQGDPLGPLLFCLLLKELTDSLPKCLDINVWYLDDGTIAGSQQQLEAVFELIKKIGPNLGLDLNESKTEVCFLSGNLPERHLFGSCKIVEVSEFSLLGAELGTADHVTHCIKKKVNKLTHMLHNLRDVCNHRSFFLLKNCLYIPRLLYMLRTTPCFNFSFDTFKFDETVKQFLSEKLNLNFNEYQWAQATLPVKLGGLGIRSINDLALPAFLASASFCLPLFNEILGQTPTNDDLFERALSQWMNTTGFDFPQDHKQSSWDHPLILKKLEALKSVAEGMDLIRLSTISDTRGGGEWLNAFPIQECGLLLNDQEFQINIGLRLGISIVQPHLCTSCGVQVTSNGIHGLSCKYSKGRQSRHSEANQIISRALSTAGYPSTLEPLGLSRNDGKRPDGVSHVPWTRGLSLAWDFSCVDTLAPFRVEKMNFNASNDQEVRKRSSYSFLSHTHIFMPIVIETFGRWGEESFQLAKEIGKRLHIKTDDPRSGYFFRQRLAIAVARGNTQSVLGTLRALPDFQMPP